jgi:hypothetical protein
MCLFFHYTAARPASGAVLRVAAAEEDAALLLGPFAQAAASAPSAVTPERGSTQGPGTTR